MRKDRIQVHIRRRSGTETSLSITLNADWGKPSVYLLYRNAKETWSMKAHEDSLARNLWAYKGKMISKAFSPQQITVLRKAFLQCLRKLTRHGGQLKDFETDSVVPVTYKELVPFWPKSNCRCWQQICSALQVELNQLPQTVKAVVIPQLV